MDTTKTDIQAVVHRLKKITIKNVTTKREINTAISELERIADNVELYAYIEVDAPKEEHVVAPRGWWFFGL